MSNIIIEKKVFELFIIKFEYLLEKLNKIYDDENTLHKNIWLDAQDVCMAINISKRKLQTYRNSGRLSYTKIGKKYYQFYKIYSYKKLFCAVLRVCNQSKHLLITTVYRDASTLIPIRRATAIGIPNKEDAIASAPKVLKAVCHL